MCEYKKPSSALLSLLFNPTSGDAIGRLVPQRATVLEHDPRIDGVEHGQTLEEGLQGLRECLEGRVRGVFADPLTFRYNADSRCPAHRGEEGQTMQAVVTRVTVLIRCSLVALVASLSIGCGQAEDAAQTGAAAVEQAAQEVGANVEQAIDIEKDTYKKKRAEGEGAVSAAGDAYNAVLDEGKEKAAQ